MSDLLFLIISFCLVLYSSFLFCAAIKSKRIENSIIYFALIALSQIIISIEILSILKQVTASGLLSINILIFLCSLILQRFSQKNIINLRSIFNQISFAVFAALNKDKLLFVIFGFFIFSSLISLFLAVVAPTNSWDSMSYHLARIGFWLQNHSLQHFETSSIRQTAFPINSEILILYPMIFIKKDLLSLLIQYLSYLGCLFLVYSFLSYFKFSIQRTLWAIFIIASLPAVILESSSAQTNLLMGFLFFSSVYLFIYGVREKDNNSLVFSAISYAIALGTKGTAFIFLPLLAIIYPIICLKEQKKFFYKPLVFFAIVLVLAFIVLSSYNYILNYIEFGNMFGPHIFVQKHHCPFNLKLYAANLIKYFIIFIDFSGIKQAEKLSPIIMNFKSFLFNHSGLANSDFLSYRGIDEINTRIQESHSAFGLIGFALFIPLIIKYGFTRIASQKHRIFYIALLSMITPAFILSLSVLMNFNLWNNRYITSAVILSSPIFVYCYSRRNNLVKTLISVVMIYNYSMIPMFNSSKPLFEILSLLQKYGFNTLRHEVRLRDEEIFQSYSPYFYPINYLGKTVPDNSGIGLIFSDDDWYYPLFEENSSWKIFPVRYEKLIVKKNYADKLNDYDYLVISGQIQKEEALDNSPVRSGSTIQTNIIDFSKIPANFKLIKKFNITVQYKFLGTTEIYRFFIYRKAPCHREPAFGRRGDLNHL